MATKYGWESVFYTFGSAGCIWFILWVLLVFDSPDVHPKITRVCISYITMKVAYDLVKSILVTLFQEEKEYLLNNVAASITTKQLYRFPQIKQMLMSPPLLVITLAHFAENWARHTLLAGTPLFLANIHHFDLAAVSNDLMFGVEMLKQGRNAGAFYWDVL